MKFGLEDNTIRKIQSVFASFPEIEEAVLYGSRAKSNHRPNSDIDLTLKGNKLNLDTLNKISLKVDDLLLPYEFDLSIYQYIDNKDVIDHINRVGVTFYRRIESEWKPTSLREVSEDISYGYTASANTQPVGPKFLRITDIVPERIDWDSVPFVEIDEALKKKYRLQTGDIVIARTGATTGYNSLIKEEKDVVFASYLIRYRINKKIANPTYVGYQLKSSDWKGFVQNIIGGSAQPGANAQMFADFEFELPSLREQEAISSILSSLDDKIDLLHRQNKTLEALAETLFRQWFVEEAGEGLEEKPLEEVLELVVDNRGKTAPTSSEGISLIATNCVKNQNIFPVYEKVRYVSQETYDNWFRAHPQPGDILFVNKGTPGCVNLVPEPVDFCIAQDMVALRVNKKFISNYYLFLFLRLESTQSEIVNSSVGTTIPHLKKTDLLKFLIRVPDKAILADFNGAVEPLFKKMNLNQTQIRSLTQLRDTLLPKLMSGEVRVKH